MKVKFSNTNVPVYKLRQGTVVGVEDDNGMLFYHIVAIDCLSEEFGGTLMVEDIHSRQLMDTTDLIWLE